MDRRGIVRVVALGVVIASLLVGGSARASAIIGASLGYTHIDYPDPDFSDPYSDVIGFPSGQDWGQPGLRLGYLLPQGHWDINTDLGIVHRSGNYGPKETWLELLPQVQWNPFGRERWSPFANAGIGFDHESVTFSSESASGTRLAVGAGIGVRTPVSDGHGFLRAEVRFDHFEKSEKELGPGSSLIFLEANQFSLKLGFDLVVAR
jgi:hypothetical protein